MNVDDARRAFLRSIVLAGAAAALTAPSLALAQAAAPPANGSPPGRDTQIEVKSLKERLSDKASDEQRVDNCRVPPERRGPTPRPGCPGEADPPVPATGQSNTEASGTH